MYQETIIDNSLIVNIRLSDGAYRCYLFLNSMCYGIKSECYPSERYLAIALGRSVRTVQRYIKELIKNNLIVKRRRGSISNLYTILAKKTQQAGERVTKAAKKAYSTFKTQNKGTSKSGAWNTDNNRVYDWNKLESALLGHSNVEYEQLLE
jgi:DNA-binding transcriptional MocR family regulator